MSLPGAILAISQSRPSRFLRDWTLRDLTAKRPAAYRTSDCRIIPIALKIQSANKEVAHGI